MAIEKMERKQKGVITKISGKLKNVEFRTRRDGRIELGARRIPKQPLSPAQLSVRKAYGKIYQKWTQLSEEEKAYWKRAWSVRETKRMERLPQREHESTDL